MNQFFTILKFELLNYFKNKVYVGLTIAIVVICAISLSIPSIMGGFDKIGEILSPENPTEETEENPDKSDSSKVLVVENSNAGITEYFSLSYPQFVYENLALTEDEVSNKIAAGDYKYGIYFHDSLNYTYYVNSINIYDTTQSVFDSIIVTKYKTEKAIEYGLTTEEANDIVNAFASSKIVETGKSFIDNFFYTYILIFMLYMAVLMYGQLVATSVATEKSSRAMELLITSAKPKSLMFGKVIGSGIAGLAQMSVILFGAFIFYKLNESSLGNIEIINGIFNMPLEILLYTVLFFVLGFFIYAFMYAALASLASKMEDIQTLILPVMFLFVASFFTAFYSMMGGDVDSIFVQVMAYIPFTSPLVMFVRICLSSPAWWEITISVIILIVSTAFIGILAAKIYRIGVLMYGKPPKLKEIFKALKNS